MLSRVCGHLRSRYLAANISVSRRPHVKSTLRQPARFLAGGRPTGPMTASRRLHLWRMAAERVAATANADGASGHGHDHQRPRVTAAPAAAAHPQQEQQHAEIEEVSAGRAISCPPTHNVGRTLALRPRRPPNLLSGPASGADRETLVRKPSTCEVSSAQIVQSIFEEESNDGTHET